MWVYPQLGEPAVKRLSLYHVVAGFGTRSSIRIRHMTHEIYHNDQTNRTATTDGVTDDERQQMLLDDLSVEIARLAAAVERQNELLADGAGKAEVSDR